MFTMTASLNHSDSGRKAKRSIHAGRIRQERIARLKEVDRQGLNLLGHALATIVRTWTDLSSVIAVVATSGQKSSYKCETYGHIFYPDRWTSHLPRCADCGTEITSKDMLRKQKTSVNQEPDSEASDAPALTA